MGTLMEITREVRNIRSSYNVPPGKRVPVVLRTSSPGQDKALEACQTYLTSLARLSHLTWGPEAARPPVAATAVVQGIEIHVPLEDLIDLREEQERLGRKLSNEEFLGKAPAAVVSQQKATQAEMQDARAKLLKGLERIGAHLKR